MRMLLNVYQIEHELNELSECIQEDLLVLMDGLPNEAQTRACQIVVDRVNQLKLRLDNEN